MVFGLVLQFFVVCRLETFIMKIAKVLLSLLATASCLCVSAQVSEKEKQADTISITHKTVLEKYEADLILPREARVDLKEKRIAYILSRRAILDTLDIPDRKKRKLLRELYLTPFSTEWDKVLASMGFEDQSNIEE